METLQQNWDNENDFKSKFLIIIIISALVTIMVLIKYLHLF